MASRTYALHELPQRDAAAPVLVELVSEAEGRQQRFPLPEGTTHVGSGATCAVQLTGVGLRHRQLVVKRQGNAVFVRLLAGTAHLDGAPCPETLEAWPPGQVLDLGRVRLWLDAVAAADRQVAVATPSVSIRDYLDGAETPSDAALQQLDRVTVVLAEGLRAAPPRYDQLLEALAPLAAALYVGTPGQWALLAEVTRPSHTATPPAPDDDLTDGWLRLDHEAGGRRLCLLVRPPQSTLAPWTQALGRAVLRLLAAAHHTPAGTRPEPPARSDEPWAAFVGTRIRRHLAASLPVCRYAHSVLVLGETGTGKELAAQTLHRLWDRPGPFVALNCAALPEALLDAELFGVEQGAATGVTARPGRFEQADGGTLFLDEISEMPLALQSKLLRVLQERSFYRVGGTRLLQADVHIVASSNRSEAVLRAGELFRTDLYFRLAQGVVHLPPLRERTEDVAALCAHVLGRLEAQFGRGVVGLSTAALYALKAYPWPGNVRELQNLLRGLYARAAQGGVIRTAQLPLAFADGHADPQPDVQDRGAGQPGTPLADRLATLEHEAIQQELDRQPSVAEAARVLGISPSYLYRKIKKLGLSLPPAPNAV